MQEPPFTQLARIYCYCCIFRGLRSISAVSHRGSRRLAALDEELEDCGRRSPKHAGYCRWICSK